MPNIRWLLALITALHRTVYRLSGGRVGGRLSGMPMLLLSTQGRRSGRERTLPLLYVEDGKDWIVVASNAGDARDPAWWLNLRARPEASIQVGRERFAVRARCADAAEAARLWPRLEAAYAPYARYRERAGREIPVVVLERVASPPEPRYAKPRPRAAPTWHAGSLGGDGLWMFCAGRASARARGSPGSATARC